MEREMWRGVGERRVVGREGGRDGEREIFFPTGVKEGDGLSSLGSTLILAS